MQSTKFYFQNPEGTKLSGRLDLPVNQHPHTYVLFAHCFTCGKNLRALRNISRALTIGGFGVLRFDFTGLGDSEGDFADTNFSSNIEDLVAAARALGEQYRPPAILVGHSLGGAAVIKAAGQLDSVKAVATIGAPYAPAHVSHLFEEDREQIEARGEARIDIGGRPFTVKKQFLEDISEQKLVQSLRELNRALLILHAPGDQIVEIENAAKIYRTASHPKSFISLDGADHLLSRKTDSLYTGDMIAAWARRYIDLPEEEKLKVEKEVAVRLDDEDYTTDIMVRHHGLTADEPPSVGGNDFGPSPYELVTAGLGACTAMTLQMYARRKKWPLEEVVVQLEHFKDYPADLQDPEDPRSKIDHFSRTLDLKGPLDEKQKQRLVEIANKCPVHKTLHREVKITTQLKG